MKYTATRRLYPAIVILCLWLSLPIMGQDCRIAGRITDTGREAVGTAVVTATQIGSGARRVVLSNANGYFQLAPLPPGQYRIEAVKPGFMPLSHTEVALGRGSTATVDLRMEGGASGEATLETRSAGVGSLVECVCDFSPGSGCEMLEPGNPSLMLEVGASAVFLP